MENRVLCDDVKLALAEAKELDNEMLCHLKSCDDCRTFKEQTEKMVSELNNLGENGILVRNGESVADAVMKEIEKQSVFMGRKEVAGKGFFRHFGLVAACVVIMVAAYPVIENMFSSKGTDSSINMEESDTLYDSGDGSDYSDYETYENETESQLSNTIISASGSAELKNNYNGYAELVKEKTESDVTHDVVYTEDFDMSLMSVSPESSEEAAGTTTCFDDCKETEKIMYASGTQIQDNAQDINDEARSDMDNAKVFAENALVKMGYEPEEALIEEQYDDNGVRYEFLCKDGSVCVIVVALSEDGEYYTVSFSESGGDE